MKPDIVGAHSRPLSIIKSLGRPLLYLLFYDVFQWVKARTAGQFNTSALFFLNTAMINIFIYMWKYLFTYMTFINLIIHNSIITLSFKLRV